MSGRSVVSITTLLFLAACSADGDAPANQAGSDGGASGIPVSPHTGPEFAGVGCPDNIGLPDAYALPNVKAIMEGTNARISFDPQGDAKDYRVYALPAASDVSGASVKGATFRCAGRNAVIGVKQEDGDKPAGGVTARVNSTVNGFPRKTEDATLGYVFTTPGPGRIPVYALGDPNIKADNSCYAMRWHETRVKKYTTSEQERTALLAKAWRDDGVAFYVPEAGAPNTTPLYMVDDKEPGDYSPKYYLKDGAEKDKRLADGMVSEPAFSVYSAMQDGAEPLLRVYYGMACGRGHDELVPGVARFNRAAKQGDQPVTELHFSGITKETTLVVEALDQLCPFPGILAPMSRPAFDGALVDYPAFETPDELRAKSPMAELFVGGQGQATKPKAISRACIKVKPEAPPAAEFRYAGEVETFSEPVNTGFQIWELESPTFNVQFHSVETNEWSVGSLFGELWVTYADWAADTNGKMRLTPKRRATLGEGFVHATMEVDGISTQRRYPQLLISTAEWPVQNNLEKGSTVVTQLFGGITEAMQVQVQFCDHRSWDVNNQCPKYNLDVVKEGGKDKSFQPHPEVNAFFGIDRTIRFDVFVSTSRVYVFTNGIPYGCADLPRGRLAAGSATVTFGDVLYHSGADLDAWYPFHLDKMHVLTSRHFSNLSFTSNTAAPVWDEARIPCVPASGLEE